MPQLRATRRLFVVAQVLAVIAIGVSGVSIWKANDLAQSQRDACRRGDVIRGILRDSLETQLLAIQSASERATDPMLRDKFRPLVPRLQRALQSDDLKPKC